MVLLLSRRLASLAFLAAWLTLASAAASELDPISDEYVAAFDHFDQELKAVLRAENVAALALLVHFPLRVNHADGSSTSIGNPRALEAQFSAIFTEKVRRAILAPGRPFYTRNRVGYLAGVVWVARFPGPDGEGSFRIESISQGSSNAGDPAAKAARPSFLCVTREHQVLVDSGYAGDPARCRVWKRPKSPLEAPDLDLQDGSYSSEGTGECRHNYWRFRSGKGEIELVGPGSCDSGEEPANSVGTLIITGEDGRRPEWYCF